MHSPSPTTGRRSRAAQRLLVLLVTVLGMLLATTTVASATSPLKPASPSGTGTVFVSKTRVGVATNPVGLFVGVHRSIAAAHVGQTCPDYDTIVSGSCVATNTPAALVEEGTYVVKTAQGEYVGQSGAISRRLQQHVASGKFTQAEVAAAERAMVTGGKLQREIAEQLLIDSKGGIDGLLNKVNPIGPKRVSVMPNQPYKR